ncbi:calpain-like [Triplophysa rosa]|uniref:Calpain-like n=1 Tax=Triplophysa rosa TaxID=992332 RepID=A0A9W7WM00_TRIRA|nr:calpain-like [Triplophysa rosa]
MSPFELSLALNAAGVECDSVVVQMLWERFGAGELYLPFYGFVSCVARLQSVSFETHTDEEVRVYLNCIFYIFLILQIV